MFQSNYQTDTTHTVPFIGPLDAITTATVKPKIAEILAGNAETIILDFSKVSFMDSSGLGLLSFLFKNLRTTGRQLQFVNLIGQPLKFLEQLGLLHVFGYTPGIQVGETHQEALTLTQSAA
ncbi:MAG: STAS domain-containing protein [Sneathiella sp.]